MQADIFGDRPRSAKACLRTHGASGRAGLLWPRLSAPSPSAPTEAGRTVAARITSCAERRGRTLPAIERARHSPLPVEANQKSDKTTGPDRRIHLTPPATTRARLSLVALEVGSRTPITTARCLIGAR